VDFYFGEEWKALERDGIVELRIAQSRKHPEHKVYVQHLLESDAGWLQEHLFRNNGVVFLCGGEGMSRDVNQVLHNVIVAETKIPYKAFTLKSQLKEKRTIV
jgi:sulfite reductase alpha subunit-like flavoprotein